MIANEKEYEVAVRTFTAQEKRLEDVKVRLANEGLSAEEIKRATDPLVCFNLGIKEEIEHYNKRNNTNFNDEYHE